MSGGSPSGMTAARTQIWDGRQLGEAFALAAATLEARREFVNGLNVFPVPDGDTGSNMAMTMDSAVRAIPPETSSVTEVGRHLAHGALMGARGNSGVILSQILRGFASGIVDRDELDGQDLARALRSAQKLAYKAVMRPVEGTMLTVIRGSADRAEATAQRSPSLTAVLRQAIEGAQAALDSTPQLLDILRQAGVVDAGGQGLVIILEGLERYALGDTTVGEANLAAIESTAPFHLVPEFAGTHGDDSYGYCTNFMVFGQGLDFERVREEIAAMGQSAVIVGDDTIIKVHIHTERPGQVLDYATGLGSLDQIKIDNMARQTAALAEQRIVVGNAATTPDSKPTPGAIAIVAVAAGDGLAGALRDMGATTVVRGGQTMNPSTEDLLKAVNGTGADRVIILPNNPNVIMTANQAAKWTDREVCVAPTRSVPQGLAALAAFQSGETLDRNVELMTGALSHVVTLELTTAMRDVALNGVQIRQGQMIGLLDDELTAAGDDVASVSCDLFARVGLDAPELITVFAGADATGADIAAIRQAANHAFPDAEIDLADGGQPHYRFVIGIE